MTRQLSSEAQVASVRTCCIKIVFMSRDIKRSFKDGCALRSVVIQMTMWRLLLNSKSKCTMSNIHRLIC
jgi:hypothetical protein